jgi:polysaccharide deacetylase family protein (PEP-CTERM system associated)
MTPTRFAALTLDVEDWWHLDYLRGRVEPGPASSLGGVEKFLLLLAERGVTGTLFVLGQLAARVAPVLKEAAAAGFEIACHGWGHARPLTLSVDDFRRELRSAKAEIEDVIGQPILGYRAPCFSLDRPRLEAVRDAGFVYDSSRIRVSGHPLYGDLDMSGFTEIRPAVWRQEDFFEFEAPTLAIGPRRLPISGGGYLRMYPWALTRAFLARHESRDGFFMLYIHPFELAGGPAPFDRAAAGLASWLRFSIGRKTAASKLARLIVYFKARGYSFAALRDLRLEFMAMERRR